MIFQDRRAVSWMKKYLRLADYIGAASLYLKDNFLLERSLESSDIKARILGHWGTVPGLNFIYANLNYLVWKYGCETLMITGPGHGAPAILANLFLEGTLKEFYSEYTVNAKGMGHLIKDFSWPFSHFPSHVTPGVPGSILEGGELGYSLATAYGAAMDNPNLVVAVVVGDGEAESGPLCAAWHSNKFMNPKISGAVLPILHVNGFKISNPTIYGTMNNQEIRKLFEGYGYEVLIVEGNNLEIKMIKAMDLAYKKICKRSLRRPMIVLRSEKGWKGVHDFGGHMIEGSFRSHGTPLEDAKKNPQALEAVYKWLKSYKINKFVFDGSFKKELFKFVPSGKFRMGMNRHAIGGNLLKDLKIPKLDKYEVKFKKRGAEKPSSMRVGALLMKDLYKNNKDNFRIFCPDELESSQLHSVFEATKRGYLWPVPKTAENVSPDGRVLEVLSEHNLQGWMQGYILTGRYGIFVTYEAFAIIISSMLDQYAKFLKQSMRVKWRKPLSSPLYILSSVGWRQDHNGYSHQNPSFVSNVLEKHGEFSRVYYPADANSFLVALEESLQKKNGINVIVVGKTPLPIWQSLNEARRQAKAGLAVWDFATNPDAVKKPDVVLASAGDYMTLEAMMAITLCKELAPSIKIRFINVSELTGISMGEMTASQFESYFTKDKPIIFNYHGYTNDVEQILWGYADSKRFTIHGYSEEGSTTTPFDMAIRNHVSRYHLAMDIIEKSSLKNKKPVIDVLKKRISAHHSYIIKHGDDPEYIKDIKWD